MSIDFKERASTLAKIISEERGANRLALIYSLVLFGVGILTTFLAYVFSEETKLIIPLGTVTSAFLSTLPWKDYWSRRSKILACQRLMYRYIRIDNGKEVVDEAELTKLENIFWKLLEKSAGV